MMNQASKNALFLRKIKHDFKQPFTLQLNNDTTLECHQILRILPKKRLVAFAKWNNKEVVAKIFFSRFLAPKHFERETKGNTALNREGILTPSILYRGKTKEKHSAYVLLFERITPTTTTLQFTKNTDFSEKNKIHFSKILKLLSGLHLNGFYLHDLHPDNFIFSHKGLYIIDTAQLSIKKPCHLKNINNLSHLLSQCFPPSLSLEKWIVDPYFSALHQNIEEVELALIKKYLKKYYKKEETHLLKKIFRSSTQFIQHKTFTLNGIFDRSLSDKFPKNIENINDYMEQGQLLKAGNTCTVVRTNINGIDCVIKRYNIKSFWHRLKRLLQKSRASKSWRNAFLLLFYDIQTPKPFAMIEERIGLFRARSYFITEYIEGALLNDYYLDKKNEKTFKTLAFTLSKIFKFLKNNHIQHGDMKANNFIIANSYIYLIDLDSMKQRLPFIYQSRKIFEKDLARFMKNWKDHPHINGIFSIL